MDYIDNGNLSEDNLRVKKVHLPESGNSIFAKNLLAYIEQF